MKNLYKITAAFIIMNSAFSIFNSANAQPDSTKTDSVKKSPFSFSGYLETYYTYDLGNPSNHNRPGFIYSHNRHNEFNLNLGFVKASYGSKNVRANIALAAGTYMNANYAAEPGVLKNIYEANAGVKISKKKNLWIDAGIFASHIGFESAVSKDCWGLTRSILADNSPYYESGVKLGYTSDNGKWFLSALVLNGWQRIARVDGNNTPGFGTQITFTPNSNITLNSSTFIGNDKPDSVKQMRYFHNFYAIFHLNKIHITAGFDYGMEQKSKGSSDYNTWYSPVLIVMVAPTNKFSLSARGEYYTDPNGAIIATGTPNGFQTLGYSLNFDYKIMDNLVWRVEGRGLSSKDNIFTMDNKPSTQNYFVTTSLALTIQ